MSNVRHPLAILSTHMPWQEIEASLAGLIARKVRAGEKGEDIDLFGPVVQVSVGGVSNGSAPQTSYAGNGLVALPEAQLQLKRLRASRGLV